MRRSRFSVEQIIAVLKEHAAGVATTDLCRKHGDVLRRADVAKRRA